MRTLFFILLACGLIYSNAVQAQVGSSISSDGTAPNDNAMLDVKSPSTGDGKGMLIPRVTSAQRTTASAALAGGLLDNSGNLRGGAAQGLLVYQTDSSQGLYVNTSLTAAPAWVYLGTSTTNYLPLTGGTMSGALNMGAQIVSNVAYIDFNGDAVSVGRGANSSDRGAAVGYLADGSYRGAAVGYAANGSPDGAAVGREANGWVFGAAVGNQANGALEGVAMGNQANGSFNGAAVGSYANGSDNGAAMGREAKGYHVGAAVGYLANGTNYGVAMGLSADGSTEGVALGDSANGSDYGVAMGALANGARTNVAIGVRANAQGGTQRIAIGNNVTNTLDGTAAIRGHLYLDGGSSNIYYRTNFNSGSWSVKAFEIDHPLDPENKVLRHYCMEGPQVWNVYAGNAQLVNGLAVVELPDYYSALNLVGSEIYSLTPITSDRRATAVIEQEVISNCFVIGGSSDIKVSWTLKVLRNDPGCLEDLRRRPVEQFKSELQLEP